MPVLSPNELQAQADALDWFHCIDLGQGVTTKGTAKGPYLSAQKMPDLHGKSVLDIGAWDGYYSFQAERLGARRVVALDHYVWGLDFTARAKYWNECAEKGVLPDHGRDLTDFWDSQLPGRRAFELAHRALESKVEPRVADFATADLAEIGSFDVVMYLGVLYHMKEPLRALERLRKVTGEVAVIETQAVHIRGAETMSLAQFFAGEEFANDFGNWFIPTIEWLRQMVLAAGFQSAETIIGPLAARLGLRRMLRRTLRPRQSSNQINHPRFTYFRAVVHARP